MVIELTDGALDQDRSIEHGADIESNHKIVCDSHVHLLVLNLELVSHSTLLNVILHDLANSGQNDERLGELLGLDW